MKADELLALAERVEARPSRFMAAMCALSVFFVSGIGLHIVNHWLELASWFEDYIQSLGYAAALLTWWQIRYEPVHKLTSALRALAAEAQQ